MRGITLSRASHLNSRINLGKMGYRSRLHDPGRTASTSHRSENSAPPTVIARNMAVDRRAPAGWL